MAEIIKQTVKASLQILAVLTLWSCANQLPPGGGDIDRIPPEIVEVYPADGTINFDDDYFELGFSEYVDKRSVKDAIFISPAIEGNLELDWSGKYVRVNFPQRLKENTTYVVTVGTDAADFNSRNKMSQAFNFAFSTGSEIDRRTVTGRIFMEKPQGLLVFAYKLSGADTLNPSVHKPDYLSQTGDKGTYTIAGLAPGTYRIFAVQDEFRDLIFQPDQDKIGIPDKDIILNKTDSSYSGLNFFISEIDTAAPQLLGASMIDKHHVLVNFSEEIDSSILTPGNFFIYDSASALRKNIRYFYKGSAKAAEWFFVPGDTISVDGNPFLFADSVKDKAANIFRKNSVYINVSERPDTTAPGILKTAPPAGTRDADFINEKFSFIFNDAFDTNLVVPAVSFKDTSGRIVPFNINFIDDASFVIAPLKKLEPKKQYIISIDLSKITDAAGNRYDSVYQYGFQTVSGLDFTGVSGQIRNLDLNSNPVLVLEQTSASKSTVKGRNIYIRKQEENKFDFERIIPGKYTLWCYLDKDSSGSYSSGWHYPFKPSEEFSVYPDTLNLRARWKQTDLIFNFK